MVQNDVAMARLDAEDARSLFDLKEKGAKETTEALRISNLKVTEIRDQKNKLKTELEVAKFSLITRENELLVAQSTKK